jgi:flagellar hook-associated protein 1 FlgK
MSLTAALGIAQNSLLATARRTSVVSQNITNANNADYSRRTAVLASDAPGVRVAEIRRAANEALFRQNLTALSNWEGQQRLLSGLDQIALSVNGADNAGSPASALGNLQEALQLYSATPASANLAEGAVDAARQLVQSLNTGSAEIQSFRTSMDVEINVAVNDLNRLLADFEVANRAVVAATASGRDAADALDQRDAILRQIGQYVPVTISNRANGDMVLTSNGATLFETVPRAVSFQPTAAYGPGIEGGAIYIDGIPVSAASGGGASGRLASLVTLRDDVAVDMQTQLDEIARGAIEAFAEIDQSGAGGPALAGLFTWIGGPALPPEGTVTTGLAADIRLNTAFVTSAGGNPVLLRDGGANGAAYVANSGLASFADLLIAFGDRLDAPNSFDVSTGLATATSVMALSTNAISWIEAMRRETSSAEVATSALLVRTSEALSNEIGVNLDMEMSLLLELEHAYTASARLLKTVDEMMATLLQAVG